MAQPKNTLNLVQDSIYKFIEGRGTVTSYDIKTKCSNNDHLIDDLDFLVHNKFIAKSICNLSHKFKYSISKPIDWNICKPKLRANVAFKGEKIIEVHVFPMTCEARLITENHSEKFMIGKYTAESLHNMVSPADEIIKTLMHSASLEMMVIKQH